MHENAIIVLSDGSRVAWKDIPSYHHVMGAGKWDPITHEPLDAMALSKAHFPFGTQEAVQALKVKATEKVEALEKALADPKFPKAKGWALNPSRFSQGAGIFHNLEDGSSSAVLPG